MNGRNGEHAGKRSASEKKTRFHRKHLSKVQMGRVSPGDSVCCELCPLLSGKDASWRRRQRFRIYGNQHPRIRPHFGRDIAPWRRHSRHMSGGESLQGCGADCDTAGLFHRRLLAAIMRWLGHETHRRHFSRNRLRAMRRDVARLPADECEEKREKQRCQTWNPSGEHPLQSSRSGDTALEANQRVTEM